jgi:uncharacterized SAM-binding protein YcdF (DUF218 family)
MAVLLLRQQQQVPMVRWLFDRWIAFAALMAMSMLLLGFLTNRWFINPQVSKDLTSADAVVVFPGGSKADERFERAIELMGDQVAPILFVATDVKQTALEAAVCNGEFDFEVECRLSRPVNTHGNAVVTAQAASERGWNSVVLVTSDDHITRSHMLLKRCYKGEIQTAVSKAKQGERERLSRTTYEWAAMVKALFIDRC